MTFSGGLLSDVSVGEATTVCLRQARLFFRVSGDSGFRSPTLRRSSAEPIRRAQTCSPIYLPPGPFGVKEAASLGGRVGLGRAWRRLSWLLPEEGLVLEVSLLTLGAPSGPEASPSPWAVASNCSKRSRERALAFSDFSFFLARVSHWISLWELKEGRECSL